MKLTLEKSDSISVKNLGADIWFQVKVDGFTQESFRDEQDAEDYYNAMLSFYKEHGQFPPKKTTLKEEELSESKTE